MSTVPLPEQPDPDQLRTRARELQRSVRAGEPDAVAFVTAQRSPARPGASFPLSAAQAALAHHHGFATWAALRRHVEVINERTWVLPAPAACQSPADAFLRAACLNYADDDPVNRARANDIRVSTPDIGVAAARADTATVDALLTRDPTLATTPCGPFGWSPLMYQAYARHDPAIDADATLATARLLLAAGADPNDGRFFLGLPTPFTLLTGLFAGDWSGQPAHPHAIPFARLLLTAGADPNDGQALYNRMFGTKDDHLRLLFGFGLGTDRGGPWYRLLGDQLEPPPMLLTSVLDWALTHDQRDRVALLAAHGMNLAQPLRARRLCNGADRLPVEVALRNGHRDLAATLPGEPRLDPVDTFVGAALAGAADEVAATPPDVVAAARAARPGAVVWAAGLGRIDAVDLLVAAGFDVNAYGRADAPVENEWLTALHAAARHGRMALARRLLDLGADPRLRERSGGALPVDLAAGHRSMVDLLTPAPKEDDSGHAGGQPQRDRAVPRGR